MPRIGMRGISSSIPVVAIRPLPTVRCTRGRPWPPPWLQEGCRRFPVAILAIAVVLAYIGCRADSSAATQPTRAGQDASAARQVRVTPVAYAIFDDLGMTAALRVPAKRLRWLRERFGKAKAGTRLEPSLAPSGQIGQPHPHLTEQVEPRGD